MASFIYDNETIPTKTNYRALSVSASQGFQASDWALLKATHEDARSAILAGKLHGFTGQATRPSATGATQFLWVDSDDDTLYFYDGSTDHDLLAGGGGGHTLQNNGTPVADESVLEVDGTLLAFVADDGKTLLTAPGLATAADLGTLESTVGDLSSSLDSWLSWEIEVGAQLLINDVEGATVGPSGAGKVTITLSDTLTAKTIQPAVEGPALTLYQHDGDGADLDNPGLWLRNDTGSAATTSSFTHSSPVLTFSEYTNNGSMLEPVSPTQRLFHILGVGNELRVQSGSAERLAVLGGGGLRVVLDDALDSAADLLTLRHTSSGTAGAGIGAAILLQAEDDGGSVQSAGRLASVLTVTTAGNAKGYTSLEAANGSGSLGAGLRAWGTGRVGIGTGTTEPAEALEVAGGVLIAGTTAATDGGTGPTTTNQTASPRCYWRAYGWNDTAAASREILVGWQLQPIQQASGEPRAKLALVSNINGAGWSSISDPKAFWDTGSAAGHRLRLGGDPGSDAQAGACKLYLNGDSTDLAAIIANNNQASSAANWLLFRQQGTGANWFSIGYDSTTAWNLLTAFSAGAWGTKHVGRQAYKVGTSIASAAAITVPTDGPYHKITGTTTIDHIVNTGWAGGGGFFVAHFVTGLTVNNNTATSGSNVKIITKTGANTNFGANSFAMFIYSSDDVAWYQVW